MTHPKTKLQHDAFGGMKTPGEIYEYECQYHKEQFMTTKRSTIVFCDFLDSKGVQTNTSSVLDVGAGMGAVAHYMSSRWKEIEVIGMEKNKDLVRKGTKNTEGLRY